MRESRQWGKREECTREKEMFGTSNRKSKGREGKRVSNRERDKEHRQYELLTAALKS